MSFKSSTKTENPNEYSLEFSISAKEFTLALDRAYGKVKKNVAVPGFRKGKVPRKFAERFYGESFLYEDALELCYPSAFENAVQESGINFVGAGSADITSISQTEGVEITILIYEKPQVSIEGYKGLEASYTPFEVTEQEVDAKLGELRERNARFIPVSDRAAENGDIVNIDFEGFVDGKAFEGGKAESYELTLGSGSFIPGFEEQVVGHGEGDEFDVNVTFPEQYTASLAGKAAVFKIKLHEIKIKQLPELDDEFAQDAADCDTLDALKSKLEADLRQEKQQRADSQVEQELLEKLSEMVEGDIPECMFESEVDSKYNSMKSRLSSQGMDFEAYLESSGSTSEDYKKYLRPAAEKDVKVRLALEKIADDNDIAVTDEQLEQEVAKIAEQYGMQPKDVEQFLPVDSLKQDIRLQNALKFVVENAVVTEKQPQPESAQDEPQEAADGEAQTDSADE